MPGQPFRRYASQVLREANRFVTMEELAERVNQLGFRKKKDGTQIDAKYAALGVASHLDRFKISVGLRQQARE